MRQTVEALTAVFMAGFYLGQNDAIFPSDKHTFQLALKEALEDALKVVSPHNLSLKKGREPAS